MPNYLDEVPFGILLKTFIKYVHIPEAEVMEYCSIDKERIPFLYVVEDLPKISYKELTGLINLLSHYTQLEVFNNSVSFDEEEYCWLIGKKLILLLNNENARRQSLTDGIQRKRES